MSTLAAAYPRTLRSALLLPRACLLFLGFSSRNVSPCGAFGLVGSRGVAGEAATVASAAAAFAARPSSLPLLLASSSSSASGGPICELRGRRRRWTMALPRPSSARGNGGIVAVGGGRSQGVVLLRAATSSSDAEVGRITGATVFVDDDRDDVRTSQEVDCSKWEFAVASSDAGDDGCRDDGGRDLVRNILVCGDGDLSYSAGISGELAALGIDLRATVLEEEPVHNRVYQYSEANADIISASGRRPMFGVNATALWDHFGGGANDDDPRDRGGLSSTLFDRIQFNFPHWRGKANNRYNRKLLSDFLASAGAFLSPRGEIHVALCDGQGGCSATTLQEWKGSWTASMFAAEHGLLLARVFPYEAQYRLSAHRGVDRPFKLGKDPKMHVFVKPNGSTEAPREIQLCCRHELHITIPDDEGASAICNLDQILEGDAIETIIQESCVPDGVRVEVPARQILDLHESHGMSTRVAVFLVVYCGERHPVTRVAADRWRENTEQEVSRYVPLRENRRGRTVSHAFPYPALHPEIKYHTTRKG